MTKKQSLAIHKMVENGGNASRAMRESGYAESTSRNPSKLTSSKTFTELMDELLPDTLLLTQLRKAISESSNPKPYIELAFKLKGRLSEKATHEFSINKQDAVGGSVDVSKYVRGYG